MNKKTIQLSILVVVGFIALTQMLYERQQQRRSAPPPRLHFEEAPATVPAPQIQPSSGDQVLAGAFAARRGNVQVESQGTVTRMLQDDTSGGRHQRFLLQLATGQTLLVAHNIDLAPRIANLQTGDVVGFFGEYEWNDKGGVIHWTHRDPGGRHVAGWLRHGGRFYQ